MLAITVRSVNAGSRPRLRFIRTLLGVLSNPQGLRLIHHAEDSEESSRLPSETAYCRGELTGAGRSEPVQCGISEGREVLGGVASKNRAAILIQGRITHVV